jgi:hypothetical protein
MFLDTTKDSCFSSPLKQAVTPQQVSPRGTQHSTIINVISDLARDIVQAKTGKWSVLSNGDTSSGQ